MTLHKRTKELLVADARNRAWRTFLQGLGLDVLVAVALVVYQVASDPKPIVWLAVGASLGRSIAQAAAAYVMRRWLDPSKIPSALPPAEQPALEPA